ncbi:ABC transporter ATP-binding protein [Rhodobacteraceae bacterium]|nr:ABC transporter ATP-binding protein [Paracoccaceae bacterium]
MSKSPKPAGLQTHHLCLGYDGRDVIADLSLELPVGKVSAILGPNGCGKSTLLHALARLERPRAGRVLLEGDDIHATDTRALARRLAILPQAPLAPPGISVGDLVRRGRAPWRGVLQRFSQADAAACAAALEAVDMTALRDRDLDALSGGQRQRAWIALTLAQTAPFLLLDEPTTWLDLPHQIEILRLLQRLNRTQGVSVVSVLHDLNLAARFCDHLVLFGPHGLVATGTPRAVLSEDNLRTAFGLDARVVACPVSGAPMVCPI